MGTTDTGTVRTEARAGSRGLPGAFAAAALAMLPAIGVAQSGATPGVASQQFSIVPGVRAGLTYSDNGLLAPKGRERSDWLLEVAPYIEAAASTQSVVGSLRYSPRLLTRTLETADEGVRHDLSANGTIFLFSRQAGISVSAYVFDTNSSAFATASFDPALNSSNRSTNKRFDASPFVRGRMGGLADYELRYRYGYYDQGGSASVQNENTVSAYLASPAGASRLGWRTFASASNIRYDNGYDFDRTSGTFVLDYAFSPALRLGAGINCSSSDILLSSTGEDSGCGPTATIDWNPDTRTGLSGQFTDTYAGNQSALRLTHRAQYFVFGLTYSAGVESQSGATSAFLDPGLLLGGAVGSTGASSILQGAAQTGVGFDRPSGLTYEALRSALVRTRSLLATSTYSAGRTSAGVGVFLNRQSSDLNLASNLPGAATTPQDRETRGIDLSMGYRLDPRNSVIGSARTDRTTSDSIGLRTRLNQLSVTWQRQFTQSSTGRLGYRFGTQRSSGTGGSEYDENAVFATVDFRF